MVLKYLKNTSLKIICTFLGPIIQKGGHMCNPQGEKLSC
jgi:hypothetical protein